MMEKVKGLIILTFHHILLHFFATFDRLAAELHTRNT